MKDNIPYSADDLLSLCKSIDSQADKTTIYNVTYKMKVANYIRSTEDKKYIKIPIAEKETVSLMIKLMTQSLAYKKLFLLINLLIGLIVPKANFCLRDKLLKR